MKLKFTSKKIISLIFIFLMAGSTFAYAILSAFKNPEEEVKIPNQRIIDFELNQQQRSYLLQRGYTLIKYEYYNGCMECANTKNSLESLTNNADNQIFLQEIASDQTSTQNVIITNFKGEKTLKNPSNLDLQTNICNLITNKPLWCVTSQI
jgi:hypothetical protein